MVSKSWGLVLGLSSSGFLIEGLFLQPQHSELSGSGLAETVDPARGSPNLPAARLPIPSLQSMSWKRPDPAWLPLPPPPNCRVLVPVEISWFTRALDEEVGVLYCPCP